METLKGWAAIALLLIMIVIHVFVMNRKEEKYWNEKVPTEPED